MIGDQVRERRLLLARERPEHPQVPARRAHRDGDRPRARRPQRVERRRVARDLDQHPLPAADDRPDRQVDRLQRAVGDDDLLGAGRQPATPCSARRSPRAAAAARAGHSHGGPATAAARRPPARAMSSRAGGAGSAAILISSPAPANSVSVAARWPRGQRHPAAGALAAFDVALLAQAVVGEGDRGTAAADRAGQRALGRKPALERDPAVEDQRAHGRRQPLVSRASLAPVSEQLGEPVGGGEARRHQTTTSKLARWSPYHSVQDLPGGTPTSRPSTDPALRRPGAIRGQRRDAAAGRARRGPMGRLPPGAVAAFRSRRGHLGPDRRRVRDAAVDPAAPASGLRDDLERPRGRAGDRPDARGVRARARPGVPDRADGRWRGPQRPRHRRIHRRGARPRAARRPDDRPGRARTFDSGRPHGHRDHRARHRLAARRHRRRRDRRLRARDRPARALLRAAPGDPPGRSARGPASVAHVGDAGTPDEEPALSS